MGWLDELLGGTTRSAVAGGIGAPVDAAALGLNALIAGGGYAGHKLGLLSEPPRMIENPVGGSEWIAGKMRGMGLLNDNPGSTADNWGNALGSVLVPLTAAKAPQIARGLLQMEANAAIPQKLNRQTGAIVWHGSPHKFDKFDSSKIGTGEGAQAYGHGLYLAESPEVATRYKPNIPRPHVDGVDAATLGQPLWEVSDTMASRGFGVDEYKQFQKTYRESQIESALKAGNARKAELLKESLDEELKIADGLRGKNISRDTGSLYKVDLPDEHIAKMLDWDKPLSQQHPEVQAIFGKSEKMTGSQALKAIEANPEQYFSQTMSGKDLTGAMIRPERGSSEFLRQKGIPGIRYLDGGSRGTGQGTSNFVVFPGNEGLLKILERNGQIIP